MGAPRSVARLRWLSCAWAAPLSDRADLGNHVLVQHPHVATRFFVALSECGHVSRRPGCSPRRMRCGSPRAACTMLLSVAARPCRARSESDSLVTTSPARLASGVSTSRYRGGSAVTSAPRRSQRSPGSSSNGPNRRSRVAFRKPGGSDCRRDQPDRASDAPEDRARVADVRRDDPDARRIAADQRPDRRDARPDEGAWGICHGDVGLGGLDVLLDGADVRRIVVGDRPDVRGVRRGEVDRDICHGDVRLGDQDVRQIVRNESPGEPDGRLDGLGRGLSRGDVRRVRTNRWRGPPASGDQGDSYRSRRYSIR